MKTIIWWFFKDINPLAPIHLLLVPKVHIRSINDIGDGEWDIVSRLVRTAKDMAAKMAVDKSGYRLFFNVEKGGGAGGVSSSPAPYRRMGIGFPALGSCL